MQLKLKQNTLLPTARGMLCNKEFQTLFLIKPGILISHLAMDSINADVPHPQFHLSLGGSTACHCCFYSKTEGLQSVGDLETMYILTEKNPKS